MQTPSWRGAAVSPALAVCLLLLCALVPRSASAQTPSPLQEWQYSGGIILARLFEPNLPDWRVILGAAAEVQPLYDGSVSYRTQGGPVIDIRFRDLVYFSVGEGLGFNLLRGDHYQAGVALGYDLGRRESDDETHLHGMGDIGRAGLVKIYGTYVVSKRFPMVLRADVRQIINGADGAVADFEFYLPLPGSSKQFVMFAGPSVTLADGRYQQKLFGVTQAQSLTSGYRPYDARAGLNAWGFGFEATKLLSSHWLFNGNIAVNRLLGSARNSPIVQARNQGVVTVSFNYHW